MICCRCGLELFHPHHVRFTESGPDALVNPMKQRHYCDSCWDKEGKAEFDWFKEILWQ